MKKWDTKTIVLMGLLTAIYIVLSRFLAIPIGNTIRVSLSAVALITAGILFGPVPAVCVALAGDFVGCVFFSPNSWFPPMALGPMLLGGWAGLFRKRIASGSDWTIIAVCLSGVTLSSVFYTTYCLSVLYGNGFFALLLTRAPIQLLTGLADAAIVCSLMKSPIKNFGAPLPIRKEGTPLE